MQHSRGLKRHVCIWRTFLQIQQQDCDLQSADNRVWHVSGTSLDYCFTLTREKAKKRNHRDRDLQMVS